MSRFRLVAALAVVAILALGAPAALAQERISIATGGTSGVYYPYGGALANLISDNVEGVEATAEVTAASVDNMNLIAQGDVELAFVLADTAFDAAEGNEPFAEAVPAQALATLYNNYTHVVTLEDSGINGLANLRDRTVSTGAAGSGTEVIANRLLEAAGLDPDADISRQQLGAGESASALRDGNIDAFFWSGGLPTGAVTELGATPNVDLKLIPNGEFADELQGAFGTFYGTATVPGGTYGGQDEPVDVVVVPNVLVVNEALDEELAYNILSAMFEHRDDLVAAHPEANNLTLENAVQNSPIPYHPGALRYYEEQGVQPGASPAASPAG
ncbi:MAG: TAXI family TRAP transporter solute-binding subunit [Chloroflexota bacterium]|nr:TAXI family TRAP transporter solute-binding subunit [Chloroflexota bacterium]